MIRPIVQIETSRCPGWGRRGHSRECRIAQCYRTAQCQLFQCHVLSGRNPSGYHWPGNTPSKKWKLFKELPCHRPTINNLPLSRSLCWGISGKIQKNTSRPQVILDFFIWFFTLLLHHLMCAWANILWFLITWNLVMVSFRQNWYSKGTLPVFHGIWKAFSYPTTTKPGLEVKANYK